VREAGSVVVVCVVAVVAAAASGGVASRDARASPALHVDGGFFRDADGGVVILRGVNVAGDSKMPPFRPVTGPSFFDPLAGWGMNVVRLLFTWEAYEPEKGVYDQSYLDYYASAVDAAASRGLAVIVDFHQDAFSRWSVGGCGSGLPGWAIPPWVWKSTPDNGPRCHGWGASMIIDIGMHLSWGAFHRDETGARTRYLAMVKRVAARFADRDAVIGYDFMNEPWGDEPTELYRLYEDAAAAIRAADPSAILFVSPHALISAGGKSGLRKPSFGNFAFSPHIYDPAVVTLGSWPGGTLDGPFGNMRGVAQAWGVPLFVGEFGAEAGVGNVGAYVRTLYEQLDRGLSSGAQWVFTPGWAPGRKDGWNGEDLSINDGAGAARANFAPRPYPRRVAGTPTRFAVALPADVAGRAVELDWQHDPGAGLTEIFVPARALFGTANLAIATTGGAVCAAFDDRVRCAATGAGAVSVRITAGAP